MERLGARIEALAGGGLDERLAGARRRHDELERSAPDTGARSRRWSCCCACCRTPSATPRSATSVRRAPHPALPGGPVPGVDLEVDEAFRITAVTRGGGAEPFDRLSEGTREQIAILTRLAFAELLADQGRPRWWCWTTPWCSPTIGGSSRCSRSWAGAAAKLQIIVLTCRERVFEGLAAHRLRLESDGCGGRRVMAAARRARNRTLLARRDPPALGRRAGRGVVRGGAGQVLAPSLSLPVAMEVGREEFHVLNVVETGFALVALALAALARPGRLIWLGIGVAAVLVTVQGLWLLPVLDARAEVIIQGATPPAAPWHALYIASEVLKLLVLLVTGWLVLRRLRSA